MDDLQDGYTIQCPGLLLQYILSKWPITRVIDVLTMRLKKNIGKKIEIKQC